MAPLRIRLYTQIRRTRERPAGSCERSINVKLPLALWLKVSARSAAVQPAAPSASACFRVRGSGETDDAAKAHPWPRMPSADASYGRRVCECRGGGRIGVSRGGRVCSLRRRVRVGVARALHRRGCDGANGGGRSVRRGSRRRLSAQGVGCTRPEGCDSASDDEVEVRRESGRVFGCPGSIDANPPALARM
eukprot:6180599-Pleurochrysis_carterae.AAC.2